MSGPIRSTTFRGYALSVSAGSSLLASSARIVCQIGPQSACDCRSKLRTQRRDGTITQDEYRLRLEAVNHTDHAYATGQQTHAVDVTDRLQWLPVGEGCHVRKVKKEVWR